MKVINLFGGPGAGKSTTASGLFFKMKCENLSKVELVTEFAKDMVYAERFKELESNQLYITSKQYSRLEKLRNKVDYIITDAPIIVGIIYAPKNYFSFFNPLVKEIYHSFDNINIVIKRVKKYRNYGRHQTEIEADMINENIMNFLESNNLPYYTVDGDRKAPDNIMSLLQKGIPNGND